MAISQPDIRPIAWRKYRLEQTWAHKWKDWTLRIQAGFLHDGASIPRWAWSLSGLRPDGLIRAAALAHDALYRYGGKLPMHWILPAKTFTRKEADGLFYDLMREAGISRWRAYVAYKAVRAGGWASWKD